MAKTFTFEEAAAPAAFSFEEASQPATFSFEDAVGAPDEFGIGQEVRGVGRAVQRGTLAADQALTTLGVDRNVANVRADVEELNAGQRALEDFDRQAAANPAFGQAGQAWRQRQVGKLATLSAEVDRRLPQIRAAFPRIARREAQIQAIPASPDLANLRTDFWRTLASNPVETIATVVAESLPQAVPGMLAGVAAGPIGVVAGAGGNSFAVEYANTLLEVARETGTDVTDPAQVAAFFNDPAKLAAARTKGVKSGLPVAAFDAATAGLAGRFLKPALGQGRQAVALASAKELGTQMAGGMGGETAKQLISEGRVTSVPDIVLEGIAELGGAPAEVFGNVRNEVSSRVRQQIGIPPADRQLPTSEDELPDFREPAAAGSTEQGAGTAAPAPAFKLPAPLPGRPLDPFATDQGLAEAVPAEGWTPIESEIRRQRLMPRRPAAEPTEAAPKITTDQRKASQEFDRLLIEVGPELGWMAPGALLDGLKGGLESEGSIKAKVLRGAELAKARRAAAQQFGADPDNLDLTQRAALLPQLQEFIAQEVIPKRQAESLTAAIQPEAGKQPVNTGELNVGDVLIIDGEPVRVEAVDPDTGEVTLLDGTRFGRTTIADGQTIYVQNVEAVVADPFEGFPQGMTDKPSQTITGSNEGMASEMPVQNEPTKPTEVSSGEAILVQKAARAAANTSKWPKAAREGYKLVFKAYGPEGAGYYLVPEAGTNSEGAKARSGASPAPGVLAAPESVADQNARLAREAAQAKTKADREKLAERQAKPLTGSVGDIGQGDLLGGGDLFSAGAELRDALGQLAESLTPRKGITEGPGVSESARRVLDALGRLAAAAFSRGIRSAADWARSLRLELSPAIQHVWNRTTGGQSVTAEVPPEVITDLANLPTRQFAEQVDAAPDLAPAVKEATTNRFYTRKPNESTAAFAGRIITAVGGAQNAVAVFTDATNGLGGAERAMLGQLIVKQLSAAGQHEAAARFLDDTFLPYTTEAAQTLQAFAAFANLTPEGALIYAKRQFNRAQRQPRERIQPTLDTAVDVLDDLNRQGIEATVKDGQVQTEAGDTVTDAVVADGRKPGSRLQRAILTEAADRMRRAILLYRGMDSPRTILAKLTSRDGYWNALVKGQQKSLTSALMLALGLKPQQQLLTGTVSQLAADLGRVLRQQAEATLARTRTPVTPRSARQQLLTLLLNSERMAEVWAGVRATLEAEGKTDPNVLRVLGTTMDVWSKPLLAQVAREYLKTADVNLAELVRNHYIETTDGRPQATLAAKIVEWLGVDETAAKPLAAAFDTVLRDEAEKVRAGLRKRIDAVKRDPRWKRTLASGIADPENLPDTEVDAALMQAIREQRVQLGRLVREHFRTVDATGKSLAERVAAVSGVSPDRAKRLAAVVQARFAERVKAAKAAAIGRIEQVQPVPREVKQVWQRLIELSNLGALNRDTAWNAVAERLKLPQWTAEIAAETQRLAQQVAETPEGINRQKRVIELHNYLAKATGVPAVDTVLAFWYANTLSGPTTQAVNLLANVQNLVANLAVAARSPRDFVAQLAAVGRGLQQGGREAAEVLRTGILTRPGNTKLAPSRPLELLQLPGRLDYLLTPFRLPGRSLAAGDSLFFHAGQESRAVLLARQLARSEGLSGPALQRRVAETLGRSSRQRFRAVRQALREGLTGPDLARRVDDLTQQQRPEALNDNARDYALRLTFNQKPYGMLGAIAHGINRAGAQPFGLPLRLVVPFTNVVANVANESLNYVPPIGAARAVWGQWKGTLEGQPITDRNALGDQWAKAALGTVLLGMVWAAAEGGLDDEDPWFMVNGAGPREANKKNQLRATGWIPFSLKVGNRYVSFANSPVAMPLAAVGNYFDARRYRQLDEQDAWNRIAYAFTTMGKVILEQSFLDGIARIVGTLDRDNVNAGKELAQSIGRTAGNFVIPNAVRQVDRFFDPTVYDAPTTEAALINSVPYARRLNRPALNAWGEPVRNELSKRFASQPTDDALLTMLARRGLWISAPSRTQTEHLNGQPMTPDEFYEFTRQRGQTLKRLASRPGIAEALQNLPEERAQRLWSRLQTTATRQAKASVRPTR